MKREREKKKREEKRRNMVMHQPNGESRPVSARRLKDDSTQPLMSSPSHSKSTDEGRFGEYLHMSLYVFIGSWNVLENHPCSGMSWKCPGIQKCPGMSWKLQLSWKMGKQGQIMISGSDNPAQ